MKVYKLFKKKSNTEPQAAWLQGSRRGQGNLAMASPPSPTKTNETPGTDLKPGWGKQNTESNIILKLRNCEQKSCRNVKGRESRRKMQSWGLLFQCRGSPRVKTAGLWSSVCLCILLQDEWRARVFAAREEREEKWGSTGEEEEEEWFLSAEANR